MNKNEIIVDGIRYVRADTEEEDYTVTDFEEVGFDNDDKDLIFGNGAKVESSGTGDGVLIDKDIIDRIEESTSYVYIYLKGSKIPINYKVLYGRKEDE
jgi:hypothetical protein